jgi:hypothetical protein
MTSTEGNLDYRTAVLQWQKRHRIADNDPLLASLELWEIYLSSRPPKCAPPNPESTGSTGPLTPFRQDLSQEIKKAIQEFRALPKMRDELNSFPRFAALFSAALGLISGIMIGKFLI